MVRLVVIGLMVGLVFEVCGILVMRSIFRSGKKELSCIRRVIAAAPSFDFVFGLLLLILGFVFPIFFVKNNL